MQNDSGNEAVAELIAQPGQMAGVVRGGGGGGLDLDADDPMRDGYYLFTRSLMLLSRDMECLVDASTESRRRSRSDGGSDRTWTVQRLRPRCWRVAGVAPVGSVEALVLATTCRRAAACGQPVEVRSPAWARIAAEASMWASHVSSSFMGSTNRSNESRREAIRAAHSPGVPVIA